MSVSLIDGHIDDDVLTDEQIIKALECCIEGYCPDCFYGNTDQRHCKDDLMQNAIDLINRQKAEIERLKQDLHACVREVSRSHEIDRNKAIEEFAERLIKRIRKNVTPIPQQMYLVKMCIQEIDNLVKEMVGEASG